MAIDVGDDLLDVLYALCGDVAVVEGELLYLRVYTQAQAELLYALIADWIVVDPEFDDVAFWVEEHFAQKFTTKRCDFIIHQVKEFN